MIAEAKASEEWGINIRQLYCENCNYKNRNYDTYQGNNKKTQCQSQLLEKR